MPGLRKSRGKYPWEVSGNIEADGWCCDSPTVTGSALFSVWETLPNSCSLGFLLQNTLQTLFFRDLFSVFMSVKIIDSIHMQACHPAIPNIVFIVWTICFVIWFLQIRFCRFDCSFTLAMPYFPSFHLLLLFYKLLSNFIITSTFSFQGSLLFLQPWWSLGKAVT